MVILNREGDGLLYAKRMDALCEWGDSLLPSLESYLRNSHEPKGQKMAAQLLAQMGSAKSMELLLGYLLSLNDETQLNLLSRLLQFTESPRAGPALCDTLLKQPTPALATEIIGAVGRIGDAAAVDSLLARAGQSNMDEVTHNLVLAAIAAQQNPRVLLIWLRSLTPCLIQL